MAGGSYAKTVAYWQLDNGEDGRDSIADDELYFDLTQINDAKDAAAGSLANPVPNPSKAPWRSNAGDGNSTTNSVAQGFSGTPDGWWRDIEAGNGDFEYIYWDEGNGTTHTGTIDSEFMFDRNKSFTAECFIRPTNAGFIMGNRSAMSYPVPYRGWQLWVISGGNTLMLYIDGGQDETVHQLDLTTAIIPNEWYHVAAVWDHDEGPNGTAKLYLNGVLAASGSGDSNWSGVSGGPLLIGLRSVWFFEDFPEYGFFWDYGMRGQIDEARFVDEALSPQYFLNGTMPYVLCGEGVNVVGDLNTDCKVDYEDIQIMVEDWLNCTDPGKPGCVQQ
ncbi:MAG: hypothetical protein A2Y10_03635 [Planctomycetes bacterium GWF2_41_51]|nr:MAG: hypothetical protein A2Y10_03635 [Planctomycetes bacterium GWF2_41_51]